MFIDQGPGTKASPAGWQTNLVQVLSILERMQRIRANVSELKHFSHGSGCLTCLEDGRSFKSLKKHLWVTHKMTPVISRKWNLQRIIL